MSISKKCPVIMLERIAPEDYLNSDSVRNNVADGSSLSEVVVKNEFVSERPDNQHLEDEMEVILPAESNSSDHKDVSITHDLLVKIKTEEEKCLTVTKKESTSERPANQQGIDETEVITSIKNTLPNGKNVSGICDSIVNLREEEEERCRIIVKKELTSERPANQQVKDEMEVITPTDSNISYGQDVSVIHDLVVNVQEKREDERQTVVKEEFASERQANQHVKDEVEVITYIENSLPDHKYASVIHDLVIKIKREEENHTIDVKEEFISLSPGNQHVMDTMEVITSLDSNVLDGKDLSGIHDLVVNVKRKEEERQSNVVKEEVTLENPENQHVIDEMVAIMPIESTLPDRKDASKIHDVIVKIEKGEENEEKCRITDELVGYLYSKSVHESSEPPLVGKLENIKSEYQCGNEMEFCSDGNELCVSTDDELATNTNDLPSNDRCDHSTTRFGSGSTPREHLDVQNNERQFKDKQCPLKFKSRTKLNHYLAVNSDEKSHQCKYCLKKFKWPCELKAHWVVHNSERPFECNECGVKLKRKSTLTTHLKAHSGNKPFECSQCPAEFFWSCKLKEHLKVHSDEKPFKCIQCPASFKRNRSLKLHLMDHSGEKPFKCNQCPAAFKTNDSLKKHWNVHSVHKKFICGQCSAAFEKKITLMVHLQVHNNERSFKCNQCSLVFEHKNTLMAHLRVHNVEKAFQCNQCPAAFKKKNYLTKHLRVHSVERPFKCTQCFAAFKNNRQLSDHTRVHSGERPFKCNQCPAAFKWSGDLKKHLRVHSGERPFKCNQCIAAFKQRNSLTAHLHRHEDKRPFNCKQCPKKFRSHSNLKVHLRVHSGEKPFGCAHCSAKFTRRDHLSSHLRKHKV